MKKIASIAAALLLPISVMATTDASADNKPILTPVSPNVPRGPIQLLVPNVQGTITVPPALLAGGFAGIACDKIQVYAASKAMTTCGPGSGFCEPTPIWTRHATATGQIATGQCKYEVVVPQNSAFSVSAASNYEQPNNCGYTYVQSSGTGATLVTGPQETKVHNFALTGFSYQTCPR